LDIFGPAAGPPVTYRSGREPASFVSERRIETLSTPPIQQEIEERLASAQPDVEVLLAEVVGGEPLRLFIDHPDGVTLALCEQVTRDLAEVRERYALEVSSPGSRRPLTKPDHFRRYLGRRATVRTRERHDDRRSFTGELVGASDDDVTIAADTGVVTVAYDDIHRSNLIEE
jgi:ribosome maturation factor RimP